jgi:alkylation response protein AidB-like acyl-CoA dehydrogenase
MEASGAAQVYEAVKFKLIERATYILAAVGPYYYDNAGWMLDHGKAYPKLISMAKPFEGKVAAKVEDEALRIRGGYGYLGEYGIELP